MSRAAELAAFVGGGIPTSEYFQVNLTTDVTALSHNTAYVVDFGGSGTVNYDTLSNFDSSNDAYLLGSSDGLYEISFSVGLRSNTISSEQMAYSAGVIQIATDGSTFTAYKGSAHQQRDSATNDEGSVIMQNSFIYKATTATTKIRVVVYSVQAASANYNIETVAGDMMQTTTNAEVKDAHVTFLSVLRIA
tara:strand:+ start:39 stop:611 length:573 start_codon:yes stop_codon:yes gene_type:complete